MHLLKSYFNYVNRPEEALQQLLEERSLTQAYVGYFAAALSWVLFFNVSGGTSVLALFFKIAVIFAAELTAGCFVASFCGLFLDFMRVKTSPVKLFVLVGSAGFIKGLLIAFALIAAAIPSAQLGWFAPLALLLVLGLQLGYLTRGVKRAYDVSYGKALGAWLLAGVPACVALVLLSVFLVWGITLLF
ncbi:MAG: hypothetical protein MJ053_04325 [Elusimicrobiaceae bacterium]|nr:hypothetical protein [Elusimicrobiaceae bacterium]